MSENVNVANEATEDHESIPCAESLESIYSIDTNNVEDICKNSLMDVNESVESCIENDLSDKEIKIKDLEKQIDDKISDVYSENKHEQMDIYAIGNIDNELAVIVSDVQNEVLNTNNAIEGTIDDGISDLSTINILLKPNKMEDSNELINEENVSKQIISNDDKIIYENDCPMSEQQLNLNNVTLNPELYQEQPSSNDLGETPKTSSRPQRQAAKKAENQIREIAKEIIKPIDNIDESIIIDTIEKLSSPLKKVCCQCNRFRLCKFGVRDHKSMYLCQEECVENYQRKNDQYNFEKKCEQCLLVISKNEDKSYCWQTKHFCSIDCLSNYQTTVLNSNCINCQKRIKSDPDLGKYCRYISGKSLQFCGTVCIENYENRLSLCSFCQKELVDGSFEKFCSPFCQTKDYESRRKPDSSVVDFGMNDTSQTIDRCNMCFHKLNSSPTNKTKIFSNTNSLFKFCSNECLNKFIVSKKRTVSCSKCKTKKFSFDMISTKNVSSNSPTYICSLNCVHRQQELPQSKSKKVICDKCGLLSQSRFKTVHIATTYNFCSQNCLNSFQSTKKQKHKYKSKNEKQSSASRVSTRQSTRKENNLSDSDGVHSSPQKISKVKSKVSRKVNYENTNVLPKLDKEVQTDQSGNKGVIIPVPVPVYIPIPMHMYVMPYPVPVPFPIPLPIPIFIPTTKNTTKAIFKDIKKIRDETPSDPFEAELLLMAGMVADDQKNENCLSSDSENDISNNEYNDDTKVVSSSARNHNSFGDDVLAMALNMAGADTESLDGTDEISTITSNSQGNEIIEDVEANLVSSTIMPQTPDPNITQENMISSPQEMLHRPPRKRAPRTQSQRNSNFKRSRKNEYRQAPCLQSSVGLIQQPQHQVEQNSLYAIQMSVIKPDANMCLKYTLGVNAWRQWANAKSIEFEKTLSSNTCTVNKTNIFNLDLLQLTANELNYCLCLFVKEVRKPNGSEYAPDTIYYLCLGVQQYLFENGRIDNIFTDISYEKFTDSLNEIAIRFTELYNDTKFIVTRVEEEYLWESKQLGAHSPYVLLSTLIFFNTKHFNLTNVEEHLQLSFSHIMKHWKRNPNTNQPSTSGVKAPGTYRNVLLRFYPPQASIDSPNSRKKKVYEQHENEENPLRCPVKLYEFYLSKCPESVKTRNDLFYLTPERSCVPDSPVWYSTGVLNKESLEKMLNRVKMVKEINVALLSS